MAEPDCGPFASPTVKDSFSVDNEIIESAAREWAHRFVQWYNDEHRHSSIR